MVKRVVRELWGRGDRLLEAAHDVDFALGDGGEAFEEGGGGGAEARVGFRVTAGIFAVVGGEEGDSHERRFFSPPARIRAQARPSGPFCCFAQVQARQAARTKRTPPRRAAH